MQSSTVQHITAQPDEISILEKLNVLSIMGLRVVLELAYVQDFRVIPGTINPRYIIEYMQEKYRHNAFAINGRSDLLETFIYTYVDDADQYTYKLEFSNNISFRDDVLIICFLYGIFNNLHKEIHKNTRVINILMKLMLKKYEINDTSSHDRNSITLHNISFSFPSISMDLLNNYLQYLAHPIVYISNIVILAYFSMFWKILPKLSNPPIPLLVVTCLKLSDHFRSRIPQIPLAEVYLTILENYNSTTFPEVLEIFLCKRWKIVTITKNGECQFNPIFARYRNQAKDLIRQLRESERSKDIPSFENIIPKM